MTRFPLALALAALTLTVVAPSAPAGHGHRGASLEDCLAAASAVRKGAYVKVEYLVHADEGQPAYEIEIRDGAGREWELECGAHTGAILEIEQEADSADDPLFKANAKVSEGDARATASKLYPGKVEEVEYEIEANGDASYEFDIVDADGTEWKVEIDAATGKVVEVQVEKWEIGEEDRR